jgi:hypothetical protein
MNTLLWRWNFAASLAENKLAGTHVDFDELKEKLGGDARVAATFLGRLADDEEMRALRDSGAGLAVILAAPAFQRC